MPVRGYVACPDPVDPNTLRLRPMMLDGSGWQTTAYRLVSIWRLTYGKDLAAMAGDLLAHDWYKLDGTADEHTDCGAGRYPVPGLGVVVHNPTGTVVTLSSDESLGGLDGDHVFLLDLRECSLFVLSVDPGEQNPIAVFDLR